MKKEVFIGIIVAAVLVGVWLLSEGGSESLIDVGDTERSTNVPETEEETQETQKQLQGGVTESAEDAGTKKYTNEKYNFSFVYPESFSVSLLPELEGESILVRGTSTEFQIYMEPFDEAGPITPERIRRDLPGLVIEEPQQVLIGAEKEIEALIFLGESEEFGETREVWFVKNGSLYQVIAEAGEDDVIGPILETLRFQAE